MWHTQIFESRNVHFIKSTLVNESSSSNQYKLYYNIGPDFNVIKFIYKFIIDPRAYLHVNTHVMFVSSIHFKGSNWLTISLGMGGLVHCVFLMTFNCVYLLVDSWVFARTRRGFVEGWGPRWRCCERSEPREPEVSLADLRPFCLQPFAHSRRRSTTRILQTQQHRTRYDIFRKNNKC